MTSSPADHDARAWRIAEAAAAAWWPSGGGDGAAIPLGVLAALCLVAAAAGQPGSEPDLAERISALGQDGFVSFLARVWGLFAITRPELSIRTGPFASWLDGGGTGTQRAGAYLTARALFATGEFLAGDEPAELPRADLLGCAYQALANPRGSKARGEVHTGADVAEVLMRIKLAGARPGQSILDECAGTGSLLRAAAQVLRKNDVDPHTMRWYATDVDPVAVAALAVNVHLWDLGPHIVLTRADILKEPDWPDRAVREQAEALRSHDLRLSLARLLAAEHVVTPQSERAPSRRGRM